MSRYFFHLWTPEGRNEDSDGCDFETLEAAILDTHRAIIEMSAEMLDRRYDPGALVFEICGSDGQRLTEVAFREVLKPRSSQRSTHFWTLLQKLESNLEQGRQLNLELAHRTLQVGESVNCLRATLAAMEPFR